MVQGSKNDDVDLKNNGTTLISREKRLGRGIASLLGVDDGFNVVSATKDNAECAYNSDGELRELNIENVISNPAQPRKHFDDLKLHELSESIKNSGLLQPIIVIRAKSSVNLGKYLIIAGERRFRASKIAGLKKIKALILNLKDEEVLKNAILENVQREDLNPIEEASGYRNIIDTFGYTHERLAMEIGKSRAHITNLLRVLTLPDDIKKALEDGSISLGHAKVLLSVKDPSKYLPIIIENHLSVRKLEEMIANDLCCNNISFKEKANSNELINIASDTVQQLIDFLNVKPCNNSVNHDLSSSSLKENSVTFENKELHDVREKIKIIEKQLSAGCGFNFHIKLNYNCSGKCEISFKDLNDLLNLIKLFHK